MRSSVISLGVVLARLAAAQNSSSVPSSSVPSSSVPTINMFIDDALDGNQSYAASVVCAGDLHTIYAMRCTDAGPGTAYVDYDTCGPRGEVFTLTANESTYIVSTAITTKTKGVEVKGSLEEHCLLRGTTDAICEATASVSADGTSSWQDATSTWYGSMYHRFDVAITAGADKLATPTGECSSGAVGGGIKAGEVWALGTVVVGSFLAGIMAL